ncbi:toxin-antitoxin system HicB family antitoxin [Sphaerochaeta globosa]|uniref:toxin-antitoxin system HicB family antitoxin n=1 Tax=Sphaerochaeta globosa TaxID=1131703 RepID=UPI0012DE8AB7
MSVKELEGCISVGQTVEEAIAMIEDAKEDWIRFSLEKGLPIPEPEASSSRAYSGKFIVRVSPSLHKTLAEQAKADGISLNLHVAELLSGAGAKIEEKEKMIDSLILRLQEHPAKPMIPGAAGTRKPRNNNKEIWGESQTAYEKP